MHSTDVNLEPPPSDLPIPSGASTVQYSTVLSAGLLPFFDATGATPSDTCNSIAYIQGGGLGGCDEDRATKREMSA